jgi:hypothetical protein
MTTMCTTSSLRLQLMVISTLFEYFIGEAHRFGYPYLLHIAGVVVQSALLS